MLNVWQAKQLLDGRTKFNSGPYLIIDSIGQGGMGQVFKARTAADGRIVAVKVLPRHKSTPEAVANFAREIRALANLDHPKLVAALDAGEDGNVHYLVTEYVPGTDLRKLVRQDGPLGIAAAASVISQVAEGLEYAHAQGIVHRDVKPGNVLVSPDGEAKLSDLGLAGPMGGTSESDPRYGKIVGTADYLSPDQIRDPRNPAPGVGHLLARLHALLRGDGQGALSRRHDRRQGPGALRVAAVGPAAVESHGSAPSSSR